MSSSLPFERRSLADRNRPQRFRDVWGQPWAVRYLSGLILRGPVERQLLFQGAHGSGKTTLAWIHADALNCERVEPKDGSPCLTCNACTDPELNGLIEYDVAGLGGD